MNQVARCADSTLFGVAIIGESIQNCRTTGSAVFDQWALETQAFFAGALAAGALLCFSISARAVSSSLRPS